MSHRENIACLLDIEQAAVQHQIMVIGEASKRLTPPFLRSNAHIPWSAIARMRDRLIHGYATVDLGIVWATAREGIPDLLRAVMDLRKGE